MTRGLPEVGITGFAARVDAFMRTSAVAARSVSNLATRVGFVGEGDGRAPVSINQSEPDNTWVCSPHTTYARYAIEELERFGHPALTHPLRTVCRGLGGYLWHARVDDAVAINNWLISTNLYPDLDRALLRRWTGEALDRWPTHAIWFRSLNTRYTADWIAALAEAGFVLIPSRQVYLYDRIDREARRPQNLGRDLALLTATELVSSPAEYWTPADYDRAAELYRLLYLEKYSRLNPDYSAQFLRAWSESGLLELTGYRDGPGLLQAVVGTFTLGMTLTAPIVGYNTSLPQRLGLYRLLMASVYDRAARFQQRINLSAGAARFKRLRGGVGAMEYSAVYVRHLPTKRRRAIAVLGVLTRHIGEPIMKRFEL